MLSTATGEFAAPTNPTLFSRLFDDYHGLIFRTAYRITGNAADAEDVLQTIFLRLVRRENSDLPENGESYFRRAAVNASLDLLRARETQAGQPLLDDVHAVGEPDRLDLAETLRQAFARLDKRAAEIFALRYLEDVSNAQIARLLGISQVSVAVTLHRTRRKLQKEIGSYRGRKSQ